MERELRYIRSNISVAGRKVFGYAIRFNEDSVDLGGWIERINPSALTREQVEQSDVFALFNHDTSKVLGRTGAGTLMLDLREDGLYYEIDVPDTQYGNDLLAHIKRGEMYGTSFAFTISDDGDVWTKEEDRVLREITNIEYLYEISPVFSPAYPTTTVSARSLDKIKELNDMNKDNIELRAEEEEVKDPEEETQDQMEETPAEDPKDEERSEDEVKDEESEERAEDEESEETTDEESEQKSEDEKDPEDENTEEDNSEEERQNKSRFNKMETRFSLLKAIREIANGQQLSPEAQAVVNAGAEEMRKSGQSFNGQIQLPVGTELRADPVHYTVAADGEHVVVTDYLNILEPLKAKNVLVAAGATYLTGLSGNIQIPSMTAENVYWEGEITEAQNGAGSFDHINMAPRRLSAYIDVSKQFLVQDTLGAENLIRKLLVEAINDKLEATILSDAAASGNVPAGIFNGVTATTISDYAGVCDFEAELDEANFVGDFKYVINPKAKAALRSMIKGTNATGMIMENDAIDGTPTEMTTHMADMNLAYGDWSQLYIGQWGAIDLTVDPYTKAANGQVRLVINAFFDYKVVRDGAIVLGKVSNE